jgi:hypothetical protein
LQVLICRRSYNNKLIIEFDNLFVLFS